MIFEIILSLLLIHCNAHYNPGRAGGSNYFGGGGGHSPSGGNSFESKKPGQGGGDSNYFGGGGGYSPSGGNSFISSPYSKKPGQGGGDSNYFGGGGVKSSYSKKHDKGFGNKDLGHIPEHDGHKGRPGHGGSHWKKPGGSEDVCSRSEDQLRCFQKHQEYVKEDRITTLEGQPIGDIDNTKLCSERGPILVEDHWFLKGLFHFDKERIPERIVHAKGAGAFGYFTATEPEILKYCKAAVFRTGTKTPLFVRFSQVAGELGSADTVRDVRGFAIKLYTEDGIWDLTGNNLPIFFVRDARQFPSFVHSQKRNPQTHLKDPNMVFDYWSLRNETSHQFMHLYSPLGLPASYRMMNGFGVHTFKLVNDRGEYVFCKFHYESNQGIKTLSDEEATVLAGLSPEFLLKDLYDAIARGEYPSWTFAVQIMTPEQAMEHIDNPFDATKTWDRDQYPLIKVGEITLNMNPSNYFADVEQSAFDPANMPPGIEPSPDRLLQGRLFSYLDTQFYRLGANFNMIPVNQAKSKVITPQDRDGHAVYTDNFGGMPNYSPNSFLNADVHEEYLDSMYPAGDGFVGRYEFDASRNLVQASEFYERLTEDDKRHLEGALGNHLKQVTVPEIIERMYYVLEGINPNLAEAVRQIVEAI